MTDEEIEWSSHGEMTIVTLPGRYHIPVYRWLAENVVQPGSRYQEDWRWWFRLYPDPDDDLEGGYVMLSFRYHNDALLLKMAFAGIKLGNEK